MIDVPKNISQTMSPLKQANNKPNAFLRYTYSYRPFQKEDIIFHVCTSRKSLGALVYLSMFLLYYYVVAHFLCIKVWRFLPRHSEQKAPADPKPPFCLKERKRQEETIILFLLPLSQQGQLFSHWQIATGKVPKSFVDDACAPLQSFLFFFFVLY